MNDQCSVHSSKGILCSWGSFVSRKVRWVGLVVSLYGLIATLPFGNLVTELSTISSVSSRNVSLDSIHPNETDPEILCWSGEPYGRSFNQMIEFATLLQHSSQEKSVVALQHPDHSRFFREWFDPRPEEVWLDYPETAYCDRTYNSTTLFYQHYHDTQGPWHALSDQLQTLIPKATIRARAEEALREYSHNHTIPVTTVHRRNMEGECQKRARQGHSQTCPTPRRSENDHPSDWLVLRACDMEYARIAHATRGTQVVLCTDGQVPRLDDTFAVHASAQSFPVQTWMMARSAVHYGHPLSTVDLVVYHWRRGRAMRPAVCYPELVEE